MSVSDAIATLQAAGFSAGVGGSMNSQVPDGLVAGTSPFGRAPSGSYITIITSRGGGDRSGPGNGGPIVIQPPGGGVGGTSPPTKPHKPPRR
jgi:beta-lactam-binding protein with PASTA domain